MIIVGIHRFNKLPQPRRAIVINIFEYSSTLEDI